MPRLTISLPKTLYTRLSSIAVQSNDSLSGVINQLIMLGMHSMGANGDNQATKELPNVEQHCHHLIIQMNALIKNLSAEMLKFNQEDFERLWQAASEKYMELSQPQ